MSIILKEKKSQPHITSEEMDKVASKKVKKVGPSPHYESPKAVYASCHGGGGSTTCRGRH